MDKKDILLACIQNGRIKHLCIAVLGVLWHITGELSAADLNDVLSRIGYSYSNDILTQTSTQTTFTVYQLMLACCTELNQTSYILDKAKLLNLIDIAFYFGRLTEAERDSLVGECNG